MCRSDSTVVLLSMQCCHDATVSKHSKNKNTFELSILLDFGTLILQWCTTPEKKRETTSLATRLKFPPSGTWRGHRVMAHHDLAATELCVALIVMLRDSGKSKENPKLAGNTIAQNSELLDRRAAGQTKNGTAS